MGIKWVRSNLSLLWRKHDELKDDLSNNYYTKSDTDSKIKHKVKNAINKDKIERLQSAETSSKKQT